MEKEFVEQTKEGIVVVTCIFFGIVALISLIYFATWMMYDPLNLIPDTPKTPSYSAGTWELQSKTCIEQGGIPIQSSWDGQIKECRKN